MKIEISSATPFILMSVGWLVQRVDLRFSCAEGWRMVAKLFLVASTLTVVCIYTKPRGSVFDEVSFYYIELKRRLFSV